MLKAKTTKKIIPILSAIISVVFAFIIGVTYCSSVMRLIYGTKLNSTKAYLANQQYVVINDLEQSPIIYNPGVYAVNISLQYAIDYDFDLRVKYSVKWLDSAGDETSLSTDNVELLFANRDNVIVDEEYIYYINYYEDDEGNRTPAGLTAGSSELSLIAGVQIVESLNTEYVDKTLTITIDEVKIYKAEVEYNTDHPLHTGVTHTIVTKNAIEKNMPEGKETVVRESAKAWLKHKQSVTNEMEDAYVMIYNYRYSTNTGVSSPGHNSAYSKTTSNGSSAITASWLGGNRAYAGVGLYIITGSEPLALNAKVSGTWRNTSGSTNPQYDNNIRFNYTSDWVNPQSTSSNLFETREYNYTIPAYTACYVEIVDNVEITTVKVDYAIANLNEYKLVVNKIELNNSVNTTFIYDGYAYDRKISSATIQSLEIDNSKDVYEQKDYVVVNSSKYSNNLYQNLSMADKQSYDQDKIILINNTANKQAVNINYDINTYANNGVTELEYSEDDGNGNSINFRADSFDDNAYFRADSKVLANLVNSNEKTYFYLPGEYNGEIKKNVKTFTIAPLASVAIDSTYALGLSFQEYLVTLYGTRDVWVEIDASIDYVNSATTTGATSDLLIEMSVEDLVGTIKVKNISNDVVTAISANISLVNFQHWVAEVESLSKPNDWEATFWRYYTKDANGVPSQNQSKEWNENKTYYSDYYLSPNVILKEVGGSSTYDSGFICTNKTVNLKPNESIDLLTFDYPTNDNLDLIDFNLILTASATASSAESLTEKVTDSEDLKYPAYFVTKGVSSGYIVNNSKTSCVIRFIDTNNELNLTNVVKDGEFYYYTLVVRPGQILFTSSTITDVELLPIGDTYSADVLIEAEWGSKTENEDGSVTYSPFVQAMNNIFS